MIPGQAKAKNYVSEEKGQDQKTKEEKGELQVKRSGQITY